MKAVAADSIQAAIRAEGVDGWLFYSFRGSDPISGEPSPVDARLATRRWFYFVPASGSPRKIVHAIESEMLDSLPGEKMVYLPWQQLYQHLRDALGVSRPIAMQYSPLRMPTRLTRTISLIENAICR